MEGRSQPRVAGVLRAFEERDDAGWVDAELPSGSIAPGVRVRRSLVAMPNYSVERTEWESEREIRFELPVHFAADLSPAAHWTRSTLDGSPAPEDGFVFAHDASFVEIRAGDVVRLCREGKAAAWAVSDVPTEWWRAMAPGPPGAPGTGTKQFFVLRMRGVRGAVHAVWNWDSAVGAVGARQDVGAAGVVLALSDGEQHAHLALGDRWQVDIVPPPESCSAPRRIRLGGDPPIVAAVPGATDADPGPLPTSIAA